MNLKGSDPIFNETANREYPRLLEIEVPDKLSLPLEAEDVIDAHDFLEEMNPVLKWGVNPFIGHPGWFRFRSDFTLKAVIDGISCEAKKHSMRWSLYAEEQECGACDSIYDVHSEGKVLELRGKPILMYQKGGTS